LRSEFQKVQHVLFAREGKHSDPSIPCPHCTQLFSSYALRNSHFFRVMQAKDEDAIVQETNDSEEEAPESSDTEPADAAEETS
jgi:hypothetical protein